jgi:hypothetical protein
MSKTKSPSKIKLSAAQDKCMLEGEVYKNCNPVRVRRELIGELRGYFPGENDNEKAGNAFEKALLIGLAYGSGGQRAAGQAVGVYGIPPRYAKAIIDILEGK